MTIIRQDLIRQISGGCNRLKYRAVSGVKRRFPKQMIKRILIRRKESIGDVLLATPALRGVRFKFPWAFIVFETHYPELLHLNPHVDQIVRSADDQEFDLYITLAAEAWKPFREHVADVFCRAAGVPPQGRHLDLFFNVDEQRKVAQQVLAIGKPYMVIQPWQGPWNQNKGWEDSRWAQVVNALKKIYDIEVIQIGTAKEPLVDGALDWRGKTTLREAALVIKYSLLLIACNSASEQMAQAVGAKAIVLYGITHPVVAGYSPHVDLYGGDGPIPCYHHMPCEHRSSMFKITVEDVVNSVRLLMQQSASGAFVSQTSDTAPSSKD